MSVDNLIRLNQIESGELVGFVNDNGNFYPSSDPSGLATKAYVSSVSGVINSDITSLSGALNQTPHTQASKVSLPELAVNFNTQQKTVNLGQRIMFFMTIVVRI